MAYLAQNLYSCKTTEVIRPLSNKRESIVYCNTVVIVITKNEQACHKTLETSVKSH